MMTNYLTLLEESLQKKQKVLEEIQLYNRKQQEIFQADKVDLDSFDAAVEEKGRLIEKLELLDKGFETMYQKVSQELTENRNHYAEQIVRLQKLVKSVTDMSVAVQTQEARNKKLIEDYFAGQRENIRTGRKSSQAAINYYRSMNNPGAMTFRMFDDKK